MKKYSFALSFIVTVCSIASSCSVKNVCDKMDDPTFMKYCYDNFDANFDRIFSPKEAEEVVSVDVSCEGISSLKGIEFFTNLTKLRCTGNQLTQLDVSKNTQLRLLDCSSNELSSLDVSKNILLESLLCYSNKLTSLDVSKNTQLVNLASAYNQLSKLELGKKEYLKELTCHDNNLTILDVSKSAQLISVECQNNQLAELVLGKTQLESLDCSSNELTSLDVSNNSQLKNLTCGNNRLSELGFGENDNLQALQCENNNLSSLDLGKSTNLKDLNCDNNQLTSLDLSKNSVLESIKCLGNPLVGLDLSMNSRLASVFCPESLLLSLNINTNAPLYHLKTDRQGSSLKDVDMGLSVKWASLNLGASHLEDRGDFYSWGETETKNEYSWDNYKWSDGKNMGNFNFTKYNNDYRDGIVDNIMELDFEDDVAKKRLGVGWRIPKAEEFNELIDTTNCIWKYTSLNNTACYLVISKKTGNYIFLPCTGMADGKATLLYSSYAFYWSSSLNPYSSSSAIALYGDGGHVEMSTRSRNYGISIRPVLE